MKRMGVCLSGTPWTDSKSRSRPYGPVERILSGYQVSRALPIAEMTVFETAPGHPMMVRTIMSWISKRSPSFSLYVLSSVLLRATWPKNYLLLASEDMRCLRLDSLDHSDQLLRSWPTVEDVEHWKER